RQARRAVEGIPRAAEARRRNRDHAVSLRASGNPGSPGLALGLSFLRPCLGRNPPALRGTPPTPPLPAFVCAFASAAAFAIALAVAVVVAVAFAVALPRPL